LREQQHSIQNYMKNALLTLLCCLCCLQLFADEQTIIPNLKFGKPTMEELTMTTYAPDSNATALILCKLTNVSYKWGLESFRLVSEYKVKIKVLKPEGTSYANVTIPYYDLPNNTMRENIIGLDASAYNMENGKMVRTKMKKDMVFKERLSENQMTLKFSIPQVKAGTLIEYEYRLESDFFFTIDSWKAQSDIPTLYTEYDIIIPEYFKFNTDMRGTESLETKSESTSLSLSIEGQFFQCTGSHMNFRGTQLPALKDDSYVWCADDYCTQVNLELLGIDFPGSLYQSFTKSWEQIDEALLKDNEFGGRLKMSNPLKEEMNALHLEQMKGTEEKICAIYTLLKNKVRWNEKYNLYGKAPKQILKEGTGSNADLNFILISMLTDAGIPAYPVVMSRRNMGILPLTHPSLQKLNTFIVGIAHTDTTLVYLDSSVEDGYLNVLPPLLMTNRARVIIPDNHSQWVNLEALGTNQLRSAVIASISPEGTISGTRETLYAGQYASRLRNKFRTAKDSTDFVNKLASEENIQVKSLQIEGRNYFSPQVREVMEFEKQSTVNDQFIYVNPLVFLHVSESPFKQSERKLPVEFPYTDHLSLTVNLTIPEGYVVDEKPEGLRVQIGDEKVFCRYTITQQNNQVTLRYLFRLQKLLFLNTDYPELQQLWEIIAKKNNEIMVLKKP